MKYVKLVEDTLENSKEEITEGVNAKLRKKLNKLGYAKTTNKIIKNAKEKGGKVYYSAGEKTDASEDEGGSVYWSKTGEPKDKGDQLIFENVLTEKLDVQKVVDAVKGKSLMSMRAPLEKIFKKKDIDFVTSPVAHFRIKEGGKTFIIVNKKYADEYDAVDGDIAFGWEGKI